jgi:hypothetical protein
MTKRKYYILDNETIKKIKMLALELNTNEHKLVNEILMEYKKENNKNDKNDN